MEIIIRRRISLRLNLKTFPSNFWPPTSCKEYCNRFALGHIFLPHTRLAWSNYLNTGFYSNLYMGLHKFYHVGLGILHRIRHLSTYKDLSPTLRVSKPQSFVGFAHDSSSESPHQTPLKGKLKIARSSFNLKLYNLLWLKKINKTFFEFLKIKFLYFQYSFKGLLDDNLCVEFIIRVAALSFEIGVSGVLLETWNMIFELVGGKVMG